MLLYVFIYIKKKFSFCSSSLLMRNFNKNVISELIQEKGALLMSKSDAERERRVKWILKYAFDRDRTENFIRVWLTRFCAVVILIFWDSRVRSDQHGKRKKSLQSQAFFKRDVILEVRDCNDNERILDYKIIKFSRYFY